MTDRVQQVCLAQTDIPIQKQRIINHAGVLAGGDATCVRQAVTRSDDKALKRIVRMQTQASGLIDRLEGCLIRTGADIDEMDRYQMPCDILGGLGEGRCAVVLKVLGTGLIRAGDLHQAVVECSDVQVVKPLTHIHGVDGFNPIQNIIQNFSRALFDYINPFKLTQTVA